MGELRIPAYKEEGGKGTSPRVLRGVWAVQPQSPGAARAAQTGEPGGTPSRSGDRVHGHRDFTCFSGRAHTVGVPGSLTCLTAAWPCEG